METHATRILVLAVLTALMSLLVDFAVGLESSLGLDTLFKLRGVRKPPAEVVIVAMDKQSEDDLKLRGKDLTTWRGYHAQLVDQLKRVGVKLVVFDLQFMAPQPEVDEDFAAAIRAAGNVILTECEQRQSMAISSDLQGFDNCSEQYGERFMVEAAGSPKAPPVVGRRALEPTRVLRDAALDHAPFVVNDDSERVRESWNFSVLDDRASLPVLAWMHFQRLSGHFPLFTPPLSRQIEHWRSACSGSPRDKHPLSDFPYLLSRVCGNESEILDYYGHSRTLRMESYSEVLAGKVNDLNGKVVFVGQAYRKDRPTKFDDFQTPFTYAEHLKVAGVEIMATHFSNLLEDRRVDMPLPPITVALAFGVIAGSLLSVWPSALGMVVSLAGGLAYAGVALRWFSASGAWLPVAAPLLVQLPLTWLLALLWARGDLMRERQRMSDFLAFVFPKLASELRGTPGQWQPASDIRQIVKERATRSICLATDIEGYTTTTAEHTPHEMWELLQGYYKILCKPVDAHGGVVADVTGDSTMALWIDPTLPDWRLEACRAALEISQAVDRFNVLHPKERLPTRIGLDLGDIVLGHMDAGSRTHFKTVGDTVNTASRIQGVNKQLGTRILASAAVVEGLTELLWRPLGKFTVVGKEMQPLALTEIVGWASQATRSQKNLHRDFAVALANFQRGDWDLAAQRFSAILTTYIVDGPSAFFLKLCLDYHSEPPKTWSGVVGLHVK